MSFYTVIFDRFLSCEFEADKLFFFLDVDVGGFSVCLVFARVLAWYQLYFLYCTNVILLHRSIRSNFWYESGYNSALILYMHNPNVTVLTPILPQYYFYSSTTWPRT